MAAAQPIAEMSLSGGGLEPCPWVTLLSLSTESFTLCSFEQDLCSWAEAGQTAWERNTSLSLGSAYGIPTRDHTSNSRAGRWLGTGASGEPIAGPWGVCDPTADVPSAHGGHTPVLGLRLFQQRSTLHPRAWPGTTQPLPAFSHRLFPPRGQHPGQRVPRHRQAQKPNFPGH